MGKDEKALLEQARKHFKFASEEWQKQYQESQKDMIFCSPDCQWSEELKQLRAGRPCYASDRINAQVKQIVNAQRENRPAVTVHVANDGANEDVAEVLQGIVRHIEVDSDADLAYDQAFEDTVRIGLGFFRIVTEYEKDSFEQSIKIQAITNPFQVYIDPTFKRLDGADIDYAFIIEPLTEEEFKETYPDAEISQASDSYWMGLNQRMPDWFMSGGKSCIVAEYFVREQKDKTLVKLADGRILAKEDLIDEDKAGIVMERDTKTPVIHWYKICGTEILEESVWVGDFIPVIPVFGDVLLVKDKRIWSGLVRKVMEEQMMLNIAKSTAIELIAAAPKTPWVGPLGFVGDRGNDWATVNASNKAYLEYNLLDDMGNPMPPPTRNVQEPPIQGVLELINTIETDIKSTNNMYDPSMGQKISNQSGVAVKALQNQDNITNFHYLDNLSRAIRLLGRMLLDLIPKIIPTTRVMRIVGLDDKHKLVTVNGIGHPSETGCMTKDGVTEVFDITTGKYDVTVSSGPSFQTKRQENLSMMFELAGKDPQLMAVAGDLIVSQLDSPIAIQLTKRLEKTLAPGLLDSQEDEAIPAALQQRLQQDQQMIQQLTQTLQKETELADKVKADQDTKLQIATMDQQTEIMKMKAQLEHDTNTLMFKEELAEMRLKNQTSADLIKDVHRHLLVKDEANQKATLHAHNAVVQGVVDQHVEAAGAALPSLPPIQIPAAALSSKK